MSSILYYLLYRLLLNTRTQRPSPILRSSLRRIEYKLNVQCFRELDGH